MTPRYFARSASDNTDDWPFWYVADRLKGNLNVTVVLVPEMRGSAPFLSRDYAERVAVLANESPEPITFSALDAGGALTGSP